jgi:hypothetical protein
MCQCKITSPYYNNAASPYFIVLHRITIMQFHRIWPYHKLQVHRTLPYYTVLQLCSFTVLHCTSPYYNYATSPYFTVLHRITKVKLTVSQITSSAYFTVLHRITKVKLTVSQITSSPYFIVLHRISSYYNKTRPYFIVFHRTSLCLNKAARPYFTVLQVVFYRIWQFFTVFDSFLPYLTVFDRITKVKFDRISFQNHTFYVVNDGLIDNVLHLMNFACCVSHSWASWLAKFECT